MPDNNGIKLFIINKSGSLIYHYDDGEASEEISTIIEQYPNDMVLIEKDDKLVLDFGERGDIKVGMMVYKVNEELVKSRMVNYNNNVIPVVELLSNSDNYPLKLTFLRPRMKTNEKIMFASMFHSVYAISVQLSPMKGLGGIEHIETTNHSIFCYQTPTGIKFIAICENKNVTSVELFMNKLYGIYSDYALKSPFYTIEMPIRSDLFDSKVVELVDGGLF